MLWMARQLISDDARNVEGLLTSGFAAFLIAAATPPLFFRKTFAALTMASDSSRHMFPLN